MILITEFMDEAAVNFIKTKRPVHYAADMADHQEMIPAIMTGVEALVVRNRTQVTAELLDYAPDLKCVGRLGVGLDNIDMQACAERGVTVYPATGANNLSVAEYVLTGIMMLFRGAWFANPQMLAGTWPRQACAGREISGKKLGLIGYGAIARDTAALARGLGMEIAAHDPFVPDDDPAWQSAENLPLDQIFEQCDAISLHVPLTEETRHLVNAERLAMMKPEAILINAARGGVVDEDALAHAVRSERLGGAALDVFETEPLTREAGQKFSGLANIILTPHIAGVTEESNTRVSWLTAETVLAHLDKTK